MIIYGVRASSVLTKPLSFACATCGKTDQAVHIFQRYIHIFWIPLVPINQVRVMECMSCKKVTPKKEFGPELKSSIERVGISARPPVWMFSGLVILAFVFSMAYYESEQERKATNAYIADPHAGDIAVVKYQDKFVVIKIESVNGNEVQYRDGTYAYTTAAAAQNESHGKGNTDYFVAEVHNVPLEKFKELDIRSIDRAEK